MIDRDVQILIGGCLLSFVAGFMTLPLLALIGDWLAGKFNQES